MGPTDEKTGEKVHIFQQTAEIKQPYAMTGPKQNAGKLSRRFFRGTAHPRIKRFKAPFKAIGFSLPAERLGVLSACSQSVPDRLPSRYKKALLEHVVVSSPQ